MHRAKNSYINHKYKKPSDTNYGQAWFNEIDADGDGKISSDEHMKHAEKRAENRFTQMDVNKDGFILKFLSSLSTTTGRRRPSKKYPAP